MASFQPRNQGITLSDPIDLDGYFERIHYTGPRRTSVDVLHAVTAAHAESIPFENIDVLRGRPIRLEPAAIYRQLVTDRRGGYCFQQNGLLMEVLLRLGFSVRPLSARVRAGAPDRAIPVPRTHLVLEVLIDGAPWLTDVGVGAASLTGALQFKPDIEQATPHDLRRLVQANDRWYHQVRRGGAWVDVYEFTGETMPLIDRTVANWYTSTHPDSKFRRELLVAMARPDGGRTTLHNHDLTLYQRDGSRQMQTLADGRQLLTALRTHFGIRLPAGTRLKLAAKAAASRAHVATKMPAA